MKLTDNADQRGFHSPVRQVDHGVDYAPQPRTIPPEAGGARKSAAFRVSPAEYENGDSPLMSAAGQGPSYHQPGAALNGRDSANFREPPRRGRAKTCGWCGAAMKKSSRRVLSAVSGFVMIVLGAGLMVMYGLAINFFQVPWFVTFALPAGYYVGSLLIGVGVLFFFIRERVWMCPNCQQVDKR